MSAIAGIYHLNGEPVSTDHRREIMKALEKFPANDVQTWYKKNIFFGYHAQWITPESIGEQLPFYDYDRQLAITADAIIDNREELFERLQVDKEARIKITDSQLILLAYEKWGEESPKFLVGDFAYMIWDTKEHKLFGARDLSGYRTLYYFHNYSCFVFCTIIKPLLTLPYIEKQLNEQWLAEYLAITGTIDTVDAIMTPYKNIVQLPPAHSISIVKGKTKITRYGSFSSGKRLYLKSNEEYVEAFQEVFQKAVTSRLRTHHQVGAQLSGGLDSGAVVGFAAKAMRKENKTLHTFSFIPPSDFDDFTPKHLVANEKPYIDSTIQYVGNINAHFLDFEGKDSYSEIDDMLETMEMPYKFFENSYWLKGMFEHAAKEGVGILLNGDRGNYSISWGYALDYYSVLLKRLRWVRLFQELNGYCKNVGGARLRRLPLIARIGFPIIDKLFPEGTPYTFPKIINPEFAARTGIFNKLAKHGIGETGWLNAVNIYEERQTLFEKIFPWNTGNTLISNLSLRHSLWKRDPTNDSRVVRFCLSVPEDQYVQYGLDRALIRRSTENFLPNKVRLNQRFRGIQGVDWVHRMVPVWDLYMKELERFKKDERLFYYFDRQVIMNALLKVNEGPRPELATDPDYKILMRSLIVYRYLKKFA